MSEVRLPDGWVEYEVGSAALYCQLVEGKPVVRFVRTSDYFGGQNIEGVYRIVDGSTHEVYKGLGDYRKSDNVLQDRIDTFENPETTSP